MAFRGFPPQALPFFRALAFHQTKEWFQQNRETYETAVKEPMGDLVEEASGRLVKAKIPIRGDRKSSLFRIHRDVRFSRSKDPYKTNAGVAMTRSGTKSDPGVLYFHLSPEECFFAAGFHHPEPVQLAKLRSAAARASREFKQMTAMLAAKGLSLSDEEVLKRAPRGFEEVEDPEIVAAIRQKHFICLRPVPEKRIHEPELVEDFCAFASDSLPLLKWGWEALSDSR
jgi:uncharacterized protein (TIGR02453 family)